MFNKFFKFLKGYVIIEIAGDETERFVNICVRRELDISDIKFNHNGTVTMNISAAEFAHLRPIAFKTNTKIKIVEKCGFFRVKNTYKKRYMLFGGAVAMILFFVITAQFIWVVKIDGVYNGDKELVAQILAENGVRPGASKHKLPPITDIKRELINKTDTISWAWVYVEGACARVEIYEKRLKPQTVDKSEPCNIEAASDGFIKRVDIREGERAVQNETPVCAGDIIISGKVPVYKEGYPEEYMYVHAEGKVEAVTYHEAETEQKLYVDSHVKTGNVKKHYSAEVFGKLFKLYFKENVSYENYDTESVRHELRLPFFGYTGVCLNEEKFYEVNVYREPISKDAAALIAQDKLEKKISEELLKNPVLRDKKLEWEDIDDETIRVKLNMSFVQDIGTEYKINEE